MIHSIGCRLLTNQRPSDILTQTLTTTDNFRIEDGKIAMMMNDLIMKYYDDTGLLPVILAVPESVLVPDESRAPPVTSVRVKAGDENMLLEMRADIYDSGKDTKTMTEEEIYEEISLIINDWCNQPKYTSNIRH